MEPEIDFPSFSLRGRAALVTGASRGIGRALAIGLAHAGAAVALAARSTDALAAVSAEIAGQGGTAVALAMDARDTGSCRDVVAKAAAALGGLDILVNNAGVERSGRSLEFTEDAWDEVFDTNLKGAFFCAQAAAGLMAEKGGGAIVNLGSLTSALGMPGAAAYSASKSGVTGMTRALAAEWARHNIRVNAICPGYIRTAMTEAFLGQPKWHDRAIHGIPMRRIGTVSDLVGAVVFLCSHASAYVTGQALHIDGGCATSV